MYHPACLSKLYRTIKLPPSELGEESGTKQSVRACEAMAFADVVASVQERSMPSSTDFIFPMTALTKLCQQRLAQLLGVGTADLPSVHTTRLREKFQESFPHLRLERPSQEYVFVKGKFAPVLVPQYEMDLDVIAFKRFVRELRTEMLGNPVTFSGSLRRDEQAAKTPATLGAVNMLLYGPGAVDMDRATQPALSLAQLLHFNTLARQPRGYGVRHVKEKETLLPVFLSLSAYARTRSKELVKELHALGLGISPTRVYEITSSLCYLTVIRAEEEGFLCPAELRRGLFTIAALDNVDHNPSSSTAKGSFHGTGISVFQVPTKQCPGEHRTFKTTYVDVPQSRTDVPDLPDSYAVVPSVVLRSRKPATPAAHPGTGESMVAQSEAWEERQTAWLSHVRNVVHGGEHGLDLTWAAFNATNFSSESDTLPIVNTLLPLFEEVAETPSMVKHGFDIVTKITNMVNPGQTPTICMDQPLFALGKILQCNWPQTYGESKIVLLMGGLHIEQAFLRLLGTFMDECGWAEIATHAGITSSEAGAEALLKVHHIKKSRAAHEATAAALYILLEKAHTELCDTEATMSEWAQEQVDSPTFYFWWTVLKLELLLLSFVGSLRSSTYDRYLSSIKQMLPHFFSWDKINYARWLTVHLKDLLELPHTAPDVHSAFTKGFFSLAKTREPFTRMSPDQVHEQNNKLVKGQGGAIGLTEDRQSLMRWMLAGPEVQKLVNEFSPTKINAATEGLETRHDQYSAIQTAFRKKVIALIECFSERGNPFLQTSSELINIHTGDILGPDAVTALRNMESDGVNALKSFIDERIIGQKRSVFDPIKKFNRKVFAARSKNIQGKAVQIKSLQMDAQLFLQLYIMSEHRQLDLKVFFSYENQVCPPSVSKNGDLRLPDNKSEIIPLLTDGVEGAGAAPESPDCLIIDASILLRVWEPRKSKTFADYWLKDFKPNLLREAANLGKQRLDLAWDMYSPSSLKRATRQKRGSGQKMQVLLKTLLPKNWKNFLLNDDNKTGLFKLLAEQSLNLSPELLVVTNVGDKFFASQTAGTQLAGLPCVLEEADARLILHAADAARNGCENIVIRSVDSDVVVLAVSYFYELRNIGVKKLWIDFGSGNYRKYIAVHAVANKLGQDKSLALMGFHAFTGCDTTSSFHTKGKKSAWNTWNKFPAVTPAFQDLGKPWWAPPEGMISALTIFVIRLYGGPAGMESVDQAREYLFKECKKSLLDGLPPTAGVLLQHILRCMYQAGYLWGKALETQPELDTPAKWGWRRSDLGGWDPHWSDMSCIWDACRDMLVKCGCQKGCKDSSCSCRKQPGGRLKCTHFCTGCRGQCEANKNDEDPYEAVMQDN
ncbi:hypothetical protein FOCC_FOCC012681 [Frankliniella occidentalis]|nr:hypothetical protein FOCC_FOCC012681 [Frankliniella occidentalis]